MDVAARVPGAQAAGVLGGAVDGRALTVRVNDFPAEPLDTLLLDGTERPGGPAAVAGAPAVPQHLLDLMRRRGDSAGR